MDKKILWFDIETAPEVSSSEFWSYPKKRLWENKMIEKWITTTFERSYMEKASIYPEFAKVVCISYLVDNQGISPGGLASLISLRWRVRFSLLL